MEVTKYRLFFFIIFYVAVETTFAKTGSFWHVTDFHWDPSYTTSRNSCHDEAVKTPRLGTYGSYLCDSPWTLINSSVYAMKNIEPNPDFIIWTGDDTPHTSNDNLNTQLVLSIIHNITDLLREVFPTTQVYAALGNHDYHPKHQMPPHKNAIYESVADKWGMWINDSVAEDTFRNGGFYTIPMKKAGFRVVVLNTVYYYTNDKVTANMDDPANQFTWFDDVMSNATRDGEKVHVIAHVPPGHFERHRTKSWFYPKFNKRFTDLLVKHAKSIITMYFAHHHTDSFRLFYNETGTPVASLFIAPAVTPWQTTLPNVLGSAANNPSIRLFKYDQDTTIPTDIWQYYMNLTEANRNGKPEWKIEYKATEYYGIPDISVSSLQKLVDGFKKSNSESFKKYYDYNSVRFKPGELCNSLCKTVHLCSITQVDYDKFDKCVDATSPPTSRGTIHGVSLISILFMIALMINW